MNEVKETDRTQLMETLRFYADMRFKQLSLLMAGITVAAAGASQYPSLELAPGLTVPSVVAVFGTVFTGVMWVMEVRSRAYFELLRALVPSLWPTPPPDAFSWITATNAVLVFHAFLYVAWVWYGYARHLPLGWLSVEGGGGVILTAFSAWMYWRVWFPEPQAPAPEVEASASGQASEPT